MNRVSRFALLVAVTLVATAAVADSVAAQTPVSFSSQNPTLGYEGTVVGCDTGTVDGTLDTGGNYEPTLAFFDCDVAGTIAAEVDCEGTVSLILQNAVTGTGTVHLNAGFGCDVVTEFCSFAFDGPQTTADHNVLFGEGTFTVEADMAGTQNGPEICGPATGTASWGGHYEQVP